LERGKGLREQFERRIEKMIPERKTAQEELEGRSKKRL